MVTTSFPPLFRRLLRRPRFTVPAVLTLAVGLGAATAVFTLVDTALFRPLPFPDSERVVGFWGQGSWSQAELDFMRRSAKSYSSVGAYSTGEVLYGDERPAVVAAGIVSPDALSSLSAQPNLGRLFLDKEETLGRNQVVLLSDNFWRRELGADPGVIGQPLTIEHSAHEIVGVMPPGFAFPTRETELWLPLSVDRNDGAYRDAHFLSLLGRLGPGASVESANSELKTLVPALTAALDLEPGFDKLATEPKVVKLRHQLTAPAKAPLFLLFGASGVLLLVACVNVAHLLLAQAASRESEMAIRGALGAGRSTLVRQLLGEAAAIGAAGGGLALLLAAWSVDVLRSSLPAATPRLEEMVVDLRVFAFGAAISLITVAIFGVLPALYSSRSDLRHAMAERALGSPRRGRKRLGFALVAAEMALASLLAILAVTSAQSFLSLESQDPGFEPENLITLRPELSGETWSERGRIVDFYDQATAHLETLPDVSSAGAISRLPIAEIGGYQRLEIEGRDERVGDVSSAFWRATAGAYFKTMDISLLQGRAFEAGDRADTTPVGIISQSMARTYWPNADALGQRFRSSADGEAWVTVVGVVEDVRHEGMQTPVRATIYRPFRQAPSWVTRMALVARAGDGDLGPAVTPGDLRDTLTRLAPGVALHRLARFHDLVADSIARERLAGSVVSVYGALAVLLASIGVFGLLSFSVGERRRELGIRMALGAGRQSILTRVLAEGMAPAVLGIVAGLVLAAAASRLLGNLLFTAGLVDAATAAGIAAALLAVAAFACWWPAERAASVEPVQVLREH